MSGHVNLHYSITMYTWPAGATYLCSIDLDTCAAYAFLILSARPLKPAQPRAPTSCFRLCTHPITIISTHTAAYKHVIRYNTVLMGGVLPQDFRAIRLVGHVWGGIPVTRCAHECSCEDA